MHENAGNLLEEEMPISEAEKLPQGGEQSSSGTGTLSSEAGTLPQGAGDSSSGTTPFYFTRGRNKCFARGRTSYFGRGRTAFTAS